MITANQIWKLRGLRSKNHLVSSLYLRLWPDFRIFRTKAKDLISDKIGNLGDLPEEEKRLVERDLEKLQEFVGAFQEGGYQGLALFSCAAEGMWEVFPLPQPVRDVIVIDFSAYIRPLVRSLDHYRRVCTLLIDQTEARLFEIFMGKIEEQSEIFTEVPSRVREGGWHGLSEKRMERHVDQHLQDHLEKVADQTFLHFRERDFDWLFLGGQDEILSKMENTLHSYLRQRLKRTFRLDMDASPKTVLARALDMEREVKTEEDKALVFRLKNSLRSGGLGVIGINETLSSLYEKSVHMLLAEEGFSREGVICSKCGFMGLGDGSCPICRGKMTPVPDIVDEAVAAAIDQNAEVFHVTPGCGLADLGSIGAFLRYGVAKEKKPAHGLR